MCEVSYSEMHFTREVLCRMIEVAHFDARSIPNAYKDPYKAREVEMDKQNAIDWLNGTYESALPFATLCDALGFDSDIIRERSIKK